MEINNLSSSEKRKSNLLGFIISFVIELVIFGCTIWISLSNGNTMKDDALLIFIDATTIPGGLFLLFYLLMVATNYGAFDALSYAIKLVWYNTFHREVRKTKLAPTYNDYRVEKNRGEKRSFIFMVYASIPFVITGIALMIPYYITR